MTSGSTPATPITPPFTAETATAKVQAAEDAWNSRDPQRVSMAYTEDSDWRNRDDVFRGRGATPGLKEGHAAADLKTIADLSRALDIETIIPGHVMTASGGAAGDYLRYLSNLIASVRKAINAGQTIDQALAGWPLEESYLPPADSPLAGVRPLMRGFHRWNIKKTYLELAD